MKKIGSLLAMMMVVCLAIYLRGWKGSSPVGDLPKKTKPVKLEAQPEPHEAPPEGPLSFWSGEIIVGDPDSEWWGYIELLGHEGRKSKLLVVDKDGFCRFDSISGMKPGEMWLRFKGWDKTPAISLAEFKNGQGQPLYPLYQLTERTKKRTLGALITYKAIGDPLVEVRHYQAGQFFNGQTWSMASKNQQTFGRP